MNNTITTEWIVTSEGRRQTFRSEELLNKYISKTRPANDDSFTIEKIITETYQVKSKLPKVTVDKNLMLEVIHHLGEKLKVWKYTYGKVFNEIGYTLKTDFGIKDVDDQIKCIGELLSNASIDEIDEEFLFNQCDLKGCHNYFIKFENSASINRKSLFKRENYKTFDEYREQYNKWTKENKAITFGIQFRTEGKGDIVIVGPNNYCYGRRTHCISKKKVPFGDSERDKFIKFIDQLL